MSVGRAAVRSRGRRGSFRRGGVKGRGVGVEGCKVSPGSLCRSPAPAGCSCSSSFLSAGCTAAHLCLRQSGHAGERTRYSSRGRLTVKNTEASLTCGLAVLGVAQVAQGTFVVAQVIEGDARSVHGLEVVPLVAQHLQAVLLHPLVVDQLRLQQARWNDKRFSDWMQKQGRGDSHLRFYSAGKSGRRGASSGRPSADYK